MNSRKQQRRLKENAQSIDDKEHLYGISINQVERFQAKKQSKYLNCHLRNASRANKRKQLGESVIRQNSYAVLGGVKTDQALTQVKNSWVGQVYMQDKLPTSKPYFYNNQMQPLNLVQKRMQEKQLKIPKIVKVNSSDSRQQAGKMPEQLLRRSGRSLHGGAGDGPTGQTTHVPFVYDMHSNNFFREQIRPDLKAQVDDLKVQLLTAQAASAQASTSALNASARIPSNNAGRSRMTISGSKAGAQLKTTGNNTQIPLSLQASKPTSPGLGKKYRAFNAPSKVERKPARLYIRNGEASGTQQSPGYNQADFLSLSSSLGTANKAQVDAGDKQYFKTMQNASALAQKPYSQYQNVSGQRTNYNNNNQNFHLKRQSSEHKTYQQHQYQYTSLLKPNQYGNVEKERNTMSQQNSQQKMGEHMKEDGSQKEANNSTIENLEKKRAAGGDRKNDELSEMKDHNQITEHSILSFARERDASPSKKVEAKPRIPPELEAQRQMLYTRAKNGTDLVMYDSQCSIETFEDDQTLNTAVAKVYKDLDLKAVQDHVKGHQFQMPYMGCNEVKYRLPDGKMHLLPENEILLDLYNPEKEVDIDRHAKEQQELAALKDKYQQFKKVSNFKSKLIIPTSITAFFYSRFESGNLLRAVKVGIKQDLSFSGMPVQRQVPISYEYDLYIGNDTETATHTHWYYFQMINNKPKQGQKIRLNIRNLMRNKSLHAEGMLPKIYYEKQEGLPPSKRGWHIDPAVTSELKFFVTDQKVNFDAQFSSKERQYYTMSFIYTVQQPYETIYMAYDRPYTFSKDLKKFMDSKRNEKRYSKILQINAICKTLSGAECKMMTITENVHNNIDYFELLNTFQKSNDQAKICEGIKSMSSSEKEREQKKLQNSKEKSTRPDDKYHDYILRNHAKKAIIITSRVHPGEIPASFALEGMVDFLLSENKEAKALREKYIVYVVPMINIDGVVHGNQRTNLAGLDLNRVWSNPSYLMSPVVYAIKNLANMVKRERKIDVFCDIHAHFQAHGGFMYCNSFDQGSGVLPSLYHESASLRTIPYFLSQQNPFFRIRDTTFSMEQYKASSARQVFFSEFGIIHSFTLENSFFKKFKDLKKEDEDSASKKGKDVSARKKWMNPTNNKNQPRETPKRASESVMKPYSKPISDKEPSPYEVDAIADDKRKAPFQVFLDAYNLDNNKDKGSLMSKPKTSQKTRDLASPEAKLTSLMQPGADSDVFEFADTQTIQTNDQTVRHTTQLTPTESTAQLNNISSKYDENTKCHHFTSKDHIRLGSDLAAVFYKVLINTPDNTERLKTLTARYINYLHKGQANAFAGRNQDQEKTPVGADKQIAQRSQSQM